MKYQKLQIYVLCALLLCIFATSGKSQDKLENSPGGYHGELDFPISWKSYYSYEEWTQIMHKLQKQYSHLSDIESIGQSRMGRDQYLLTISAKETGKDTEKTAMWVDGAVHGNEVNGITCSLYLAWYLLSRYDYDKYVHDLVDNCTFYILPGVNVDANASFVEYPNTGSNPREPFRPEDNDGDGLYDEDRTEDVDGDGELSTMYIADPNGNLKLSEDKRRFIPVSYPEEKVLRFRRIGSEGFDNDGDGRINEDDIGGPDPNRNYPFGWSLQEGNPYPMSENCTRNVFEFQLKHPNIFASFHYHNTGRLIMMQAPPAVSGRQLTAEQQKQSQERFDSRLANLRKTNKYAMLFNRQVASEFRHDMETQTSIVSTGSRILKNYNPTIGGLSGQAHAATYYMLGAYSYLIELWGSPTSIADENDDGRLSDEEMMHYIDYDLTGEGWIKPHKYNHPDLGEIWIGGSETKHMRRTPPGRFIEQEAEKNALFVMYCASQFPKVEIEKISIIPATQDLFWVDVNVKNDKTYPTSSDMSVKLKRTVKDKLSLNTSKNISLIDVPDGNITIDPLNYRSRANIKSGKSTEFRLNGKQNLKFRYLVKMKGKKGWIEFDINSQRGGKDKKRIDIKVG
ncbi:M14 family metallopeptidase [Bacteroidota bacterium]